MPNVDLNENAKFDLDQIDDVDTSDEEDGAAQKKVDIQRIKDSLKKKEFTTKLKGKYLLRSIFIGVYGGISLLMRIRKVRLR